MEYAGRHVLKHFPGHGWFDGVVREMVEVKGELFGRVSGFKVAVLYFWCAAWDAFSSIGSARN